MIIDHLVHSPLLFDPVPLVAQVQKLIHENHLFLNYEVTPYFHHSVIHELQVDSMQLIFQN